MECVHCNKNFSGKSALLLHQKTAKYCILIQNTTTTTEYEELECKSCNKKFTIKNNFSRHISTCKVLKQSLHKDLQAKNIDYNRIIQEKDIIIEELRAQIEVYKSIDNRYVKDISKHVITTKMVSNMTPLDLRKELFTDIINEYYTTTHMLDGQKGVAKFALDF